MAHIREWSTTAASNNGATPDGWPEGQAPSTVNDCAREMMAQLKTWYLQSFTNHITGLELSNGTDTAHDIDVAIGAAMDTTGVEIMEQTTAGLTKQIDAVWAVGNDAGGLDTGTVAADTVYGVWLIADVTNNVVDVLFSTAFVVGSVTFPTNYTLGRLIGAVVTDSSANILSFVQSGDYFRLTGGIITDVNDSTITNDTFETGTLSVPPLSLAHIYAQVENATSADTIMRMLVRTKGAVDGVTNAVIGIDNDAANVQKVTAEIQTLVDSSAQIEYATREQTGACTVKLITLGFTMLSRSRVA